MGQLPAQIQDFIIQIQGGQSALTALAQQGSQVATSFGGVGNALRAVGSLISPTVAIAAAAAVTVGVLAKAYNDGASEAQAYSRALILSGNAAGTTAAQLQAMAAAQSKVVGTQSQAADALAQLAATGRVAGTQLSTAAEAAVRFARVGGDVGEVVKKFSDLGKEPLEALKRLNDSENFLTLSVYKQVKALTEQGRLTEAAKVAQDEYARVTIGRSKEIEQNLGALETAWKGIKDGASAAWDAMLGIGRRATVQDLIKELEQQLEAARSRGISISKTAFAGGTIGAGGPQPFVQVQVESTAEQLRDRIEALREVERLERRAADAKRDGAAAVKAQIKADEDAAKALAKANAEREREAAALERAIGLSGSYYKDLAEIGKLRQQGKLTEEQYIAAVQKLITEQPKVREQVQAEAEARKASQKVLDDQAKAYERTLDAQIKSGASVEEQIQKFKDENDAIGLAASQNISLAAAVELVHAARRKEALDTAVRQGDYLTASYLEDEIKKRKELAGLINSKDAREAAKKSAEDAAREWQRASEAAKKSAEDAAREWQRASGEIERTLTDALMRGFESGKSFASTLRDTVVNMFKTMVLRPVVSAIVSPVAGALAGSLGFSAAASAAGAAGGAGGFGALSAAGAASAMYPLLSNFGLAAQNFFTNAGTSLFNMGAESAGNFLIGNAGNLGYIANSLGTGLSYLSSIKALADGRYGAGLLGGAGTFLGGPIGGLIGNVIGGAIDKVFGGAGTHHAGAGYVSDGTTGQNVSNGGYGLAWSYGDSVQKYYSQGISDGLKTITGGSAALLNNLSKS
ncbi:MAG TPA: phage tail length tape measure family protein, partial [Burkholderiaceae bacterium]|nr:phage tail length tape measure family protein [Burkholderiaceae bacterium]